MAATKIMIIRHAEKPTTTPPAAGVTIAGDQNEDSLIVRGWQRAGALVPLFAPSRGPIQSSDLATPQFIFAAASSDPEGNRPEETITPLAQQLNLTPNETYSKTEVEQVATAAVACEGVVLISWPHGQIPNVCDQIPLSPNNVNAIPSKWPGDRFDMVFVFDFDTSPAVYGYNFNQVPQLLLKGDSDQPIPSGS
ncbi:MAG TPA: hypothetical protein VJS17_13105 [Pyrinomonadaceae bacterium]|nr:hypothetical protein [Pyrinomonadaceae bacterium]